MFAVFLIDAPAAVAASFWSSPATIDFLPAPGGFLAGFEGVSCASERLCVAIDAGGNVVTSTSPAGGSSGWIGTAGVDPSVSDNYYPTTVSCSSSSLCAFADTAGNVVASGDATGGAGAWSIAKIASYDQLFGISCPSSTLCVALNIAGRVFTSTNPTEGSGAWSSSPVSPAPSGRLTPNVLRTLTCASAELCVIGSNYRQVLVSTNPLGGASTWKTARRLNNLDPLNLSAISCPTVRFCAAVDHDTGDVLVSADPTESGSWHAAKIDQGLAGAALVGISCPSSRLCEATDDEGRIVSSIDPTAGSRAWTTTVVAGGEVFAGVSCPSIHLCVAVDADGEVVTSTDPSGPAELAARPFLSGSSLIRATTRHPRLTFTATAGRPPAHAIRQIMLRPPSGIELRTRGHAITVTNPAGKSIAFTARLNARTLLITLTRAATNAQVTIAAPAIAISRPLGRAIKSGRAKTLTFISRLTDTRRVRTIVTFTIKR